MRKNIIYVDFIYSHKKVNFLKFLITTKSFSIIKYLKFIFLNNKKIYNSNIRVKNVQ